MYRQNIFTVLLYIEIMNQCSIEAVVAQGHKGVNVTMVVDSIPFEEINDNIFSPTLSSVTQHAMPRKTLQKVGNRVSYLLGVLLTRQRPTRGIHCVKLIADFLQYCNLHLINYFLFQLQGCKVYLINAIIIGIYYLILQYF